MIRNSNYQLKRIYLDNKNFIPEISMEFEYSSASFYHYITNVLRYKTQSKFIIFHENFGEYIVEITRISSNSIYYKPIEQIKPSLDLSNTAGIHLIFSPIKNTKTSSILRMASELGVTNFHPTLMDRTIKKSLDTEREYKVIIEAIQQCEKLRIPQLYNIDKFSKKISSLKFNDKNIAILANERDTEFTFESLRSKNLSNLENIYIIVGPEGGFSDSEYKFLLSLEHCHSLHLEGSVLRVDTAIISVISLIQFAL